MIAEVHIDALQIHASPPGANYAVSRFTGIGSPPPRANRPNRARKHGAYGLTTYYEPRVFAIEGRVKAATDAAFWPLVDALKQKFALVGSSHTLKWRRSGLAYLERSIVIVDGDFELDFDPYNPSAKWAVQVVAPDPRMYGDTLRTVNFASTGNAQNDGIFNSPPVITFHGAGTDPGLRNNTLAAENVVQIEHVMVGGDEIVVDCAQATAYLNGTERPDIVKMPDTFFWSLVAGANALEKLGGATSVDVDWRDARI